VAYIATHTYYYQNKSEPVTRTACDKEIDINTIATKNKKGQNHHNL
jgi:hypothetical protein